jgi:hypothetical protein
MDYCIVLDINLWYNKLKKNNMVEIKSITEDDYKLIVDWNNGKNKDYLSQWAGIKNISLSNNN